MDKNKQTPDMVSASSAEYDIESNPNLLEAAIYDPIRKDFNLNIIFADENKKPLHKGWNKWITKKQTDEDIALMYMEQHTNYGYLTGFNGLVAIDFDAAWVYHEALEYFGDRLNTFTVKTPNGGYHSYFIVKHPETYVQYKKTALHVEILGNYNTIVHGTAKTVEGKTVKYEIINTEGIREDESIIKDMKKFIRDTLTKYKFLNFKCIRGKLSEKINHLTHEQRLDISNFFLQEDTDISTATNFFRLCSDFDAKTTRYQIEKTRDKIETGDLKHPKCKELRKNFDWDVKDCGGCKRHEKPTIKSKEKNDVKPVSTEEIVRKLSQIKPKHRHGQGCHPEYGLTFLSTYPELTQKILGISRKKVIETVHESFLDGFEVAPDYYVCGGYTDPLTDKTKVQIVKLMEEFQKNSKFDFKQLSEIYETLLHNSSKYLDFSNINENISFLLWIIGTYFRALFIWYPYLSFEGLRDVGKSTALEYLSLTCFNGGGDVSGGYTEADLHKAASSTMGFFAIDHLEEKLKSPEKSQVINEFLENAWKLNSYVSKRDQKTGDRLKLYLASSVALGTRRTSEVLREKGIIIRMFETDNDEIRKNSITMYKDSIFDNIEGNIIKTALKYQDCIKNTYEDIEVIPSIGREFNKFLPLLAIAKVIDQDNNNKYQLYDKMVNFTINYRKERKAEQEDLEEILLRMILEEDINKTTYSKLAEGMQDRGYQYYKWQTAKSDIGKLGIIKKYNKTSSSVSLSIDLERAKERANKRGIKIDEKDASMEE